MWQLFFFLIGFVFCTYNETDIETLDGKDVNLQCFGTNPSDPILSITWNKNNGTIFFSCNRLVEPCEQNNTRHTLERNETSISSTLTLWNVSLVHEDEYDITMLSKNDVKTCKINLTVNVPPKRLIVVEIANGTILQNQGSLAVAEGENKTLVCKTSTSVKPAVNLEWVIPTELNIYLDSQNFVNDESDQRLLVPTRKIHFTPTYADDKDIVLVCKVASNSSFDNIQTSVLIRNEGELTTYSDTTGTGSKESHTMTASSGTSYATPFGRSSPEPTEEPRNIQIRFVIPGCSGVVMLLIVMAFVGGFIRSKKRGVRHSMNAESTEFRPPQGRRSLPPTPSDESSLPANHLSGQPPPTARLPRPVPSIPSDIPMRPLVPVSEDAFRNPAERTGSRMTGETFTTAAGSTALTQAQRELETEMEYDLLNHSYHVHRGAVSHVYRETTNGLAEYALVSRPKVNKRIDQRQLHRSKQMDDDSEYDVLNTLNQTEHGTVPHVYKETTSGLAEYAVVSKPNDRKKRQSLGSLTKVMKAPINVKTEYAVVDKSKKRTK